jgi:hypothetical protein
MEGGRSGISGSAWPGPLKSGLSGLSVCFVSRVKDSANRPYRSAVPEAAQGPQESDGRARDVRRGFGTDHVNGFDSATVWNHAGISSIG